MAYHPLTDDTGGTSQDRRNEADRIIKMLLDLDREVFTPRELEFWEGIDDVQPISPKQLFWLRDIKDKYL